MSVELTVPEIGESLKSVFVGRWFKKPGDPVRAGEPVVAVDSDKASMEVPSPVDGVLTEALVSEGDEVPIGAVLARIEEGAVATSAPAALSATKSADPGTGEVVRAGPAARQLANTIGTDLSAVPGTGRGGRVTTGDVRRASEPATSQEQEVPQVPAPAALGDSERVREVRMSPLRRTIARRLVEAQQTAAILTTFNEVDMTAVMALRAKYKASFLESHGVKLGFMSFFVKATIEALKAYPAANSEISGDMIRYKDYYNIGVAVSGPKGLVVPVVKDADQLSFAGVERAIGELGVRARDNKLNIRDFQDGTFTISNGGVFGSLMSTPILNPPQVGILGMHNIVRRPMAVGTGSAERIEIRPMMYVALSYDHRIIDGREAVGFLVRIKQCVEDPERLLLEV